MKDMRRRHLLGILGGAAIWPITTRAQQSAQQRLIGVLSQGSAHTHPTPPFRAFLERLQQKGWEVGRNLSIEWRFSEGSTEPLPRLARELVETPVELIVTAPTEPTLAAKQATSNIPIVFLHVADPVQSRIVTNLARPDANVTGMSVFAPDIAGKRLALIKEALPSTKLLSVLWNKPSKGAVLVRDEIFTAGVQLGIEIQDIGIDSASEIDGALRKAVSTHAAAVVVIDDPVMQSRVEAVVQIALGLKLPLVSQSAGYANSGGLMSYGPDFNEVYRNGAEYVDRILRGAKPGDLPVQQPEKFKLLLNLKTAKTLEIEFPPQFLARADEVIE
jgi:putative ABC transport system substrate-binding protein